MAGRPRFDGALEALRGRVLAGLSSRGPRMVGRYRLGSAIGSGAFGTVYEAEDPELRRKVAIKLFAAGTAQHRERVLREARMLATVSSPHVVHVFEVGTVDDTTAAPYLVMELVSGPTLRAYLTAAPRPWREVLALVLAAARGLAAAHRCGVIHRDFKPDNVILASDGRPRVIDFGLARVAGGEDEDTAPGRPPPGTTDASLTPTGHTMGTPAYMAPEAFGGPCTPRSDQYSLCVTLYEGLFGARPFPARTTEELLAQIRREDPTAPRDRRGVPRAVVAAVMRGLQRDPARRFRDLDALVGTLEHAMGSRRTIARWLGAAAVATALVAAGAGSTGQRCEVGDAAWAELAAPTQHLEAAQQRYAARWREVESTVCAAEPTGMTAAQRHCLERRLDDVAAVHRVFAQLDPEARGELTDPYGSLPRPEDCVAPSQGEAPVAVLTDAGALARLETGASQLRALMVAASPSDGLALSPGLLAEARALGYAPMIAELGYAHARLLLLASQYRESASAFEDLYLLAHAAGLDGEAARAASDLLRVHGYYLGDPAAGRRWAEHATAAFARAGVEPTRHTTYVDGLAGLAEREGDLDGAVALLRRAIEEAAARGEARDGPTGGLHNRLGVALVQLDRPADAVVELTTAASIFAETNGPDSPPRASALGNLGMALVALERFDEALVHHRESLAIRETMLDEDHMDLGAAFGNMAEVLERLGRRDEALPHVERALGVFTRRLGAEHPYVATALELRGRILAAGSVDDRRAARDDFEHAIRILETLGPQHAEAIAEVRRSIAALGDTGKGGAQ